MINVNWRRWNKLLHRDIGYIISALVIVYGVSGLAVNHMADWNPNYTFRKEIVTIEPIGSQDKDSIITAVMNQLRLEEHPENFFRPDPETAQLFYAGKTYSIDLPTGSVLIETNPKRMVLFQMNQLHLNAVKGTWTYIADLFAIALIFMGVSGLFMLRGTAGLAGRGKWLVAAGAMIPIGYWIFYQYFS